MKKLILASVFVLGSVLAVSAQTTENKSCHGNEGANTKSSCCKSSNTTTTTTSNTKSCCSKGTSHASTGTGNKSLATSATAAFATTKSETEKTTVETGEPK